MTSGPGSGTPLLELRTVESGYNRQIRVLKGVSLAIDHGSCVAVLGSNGAGKSTMLKTIMGLIDDEPRKGSVRVLGKEMTHADTEAISRAGVAYVVEDRGMFPDLTVAQSLRLGAYHRYDRSGVND
ncbi:MAG TPA: ATP-binding cassette domain-containing protein, partial [Trueperaceae bacterium]|nr:ATP-binding cassette domain-containing protein [Trueperaceae bacterium]